MNRIGFMQGRLSPQVDGKIQAFPWQHWESEFVTAQRIGLSVMEWTLDADRIFENPIMTPAGQARISVLSAQHDVQVASLTGDCFMQEPFWKAAGTERRRRIDVLRAVLDAAARVGIRYVVVPLVDNGRLDTRTDEDDVVANFGALESVLKSHDVAIVFEIDYQPADVARFIARLPASSFGINYDMGNSAALGYSVREEIARYGSRILNVHVKDRLLRGTTVPLGSGNADLPAAFDALRSIDYQGNYILQTARAEDGDHAGALLRYLHLTQSYVGDGLAAV